MCSIWREFKVLLSDCRTQYRYWDLAEIRTFMGEDIRYYVPAFRQNATTNQLQKLVERPYEDGSWAYLTPEEEEVFRRQLPAKLESGALRVRL